MSKRQRKHNHVVSSVLAAALAFTAIVSSVQLASVSDDLAANVSGRYVAVLTCANGTLPVSGVCADGSTPLEAGGGGSVCSNGQWMCGNGQCSVGGLCSVVDGSGGGTIQCQSLNNRSVTIAECTAADTAKNACVAPSTWNGTTGSGTCTAGGGGASSYTTPDACTREGFFWYNNVCNNSVQVVGGGTASSYTTSATCGGAVFFWSTIKNMCYSTQLEKTNAESAGGGSNITCGNGSIHTSPYTCTPQEDCAAGTTWNGTSCTAGGGGDYSAGTCPQGSANAGTLYPAGTGTPPCGSTTINQTCTGATPIPCSNGTCAATQLECSSTVGCSNGQVKDSTGQCVTSTQCGRGQVWNGTSCVNTSPADTANTACGYNQYWDGTACVQFTAPMQPATYQDFFQGPQCSRDASHIDAFCFGSHQWNDPTACKAYDENRDGKPDYEWDLIRSDCFPKFGGGMMTMAPPPMPFPGKMIPGVAPSMTQSAGADFTQWMKVGGTEDFCSTTTGRNDPGCAFQRMQGTKSTTDMYSMIKTQAQALGTNTIPDAADFKAYGEVERMYDKMRFETGGVYCPEIEQLGKVLYEAETNNDSAIIAAVAAGSDTYVKQLDGCGGVHRFNELTDLRLKVDGLPASQGKDDLLAKIDEVSTDPKALDNPRVMGDLWKAYGMLQRNFEQDRAEEGPCNSIERTKGDIEDYLSGAHDVKFSGEEPPKEVIEGVVVEIETALAEAKKIGGSEGKKVCQDMKEKLKRMERIYFGNEGGVLYDPMAEYMENLYGDSNYINSQTMMFVGVEGADLVEIKAFIKQTIMEQFAKMKDEIIATVRAEFKTALGTTVDWDAFILGSPILSGATTAVSDVTESLSVISGNAESIQRQAAEDLASDLEQLSPALVDPIYAGQEEVLTGLLKPILTADPEVLEGVKEPLEDLFEIVVGERLPAETVDELTAYTLVGPITNAIEASGVVNDNGIYIIEDEDDREVVVEILRDVIAEALEIVEPERLKEDQIEAGLRVDFPDIVGDEWHAKALLGRVADGSTHGEGDGTANPGGTLLGGHIATTTQRMLGGNASTSLLGDQASGMDAWIHEGAALALEAGAVASNVAQVMITPASRSEAIYMRTKMIAHENPDIRKLMDELTCTLDDDDLADTNCSMEHRDEINLAVNLGIVRGQESADGTLSLAPDSIIVRAEDWTMQGRWQTALNELEAVGPEEMLARMSGTDDVSIGDPTGNREGLVDPTF